MHTKGGKLELPGHLIRMDKNRVVEMTLTINRKKINKNIKKIIIENPQWKDGYKGNELNRMGISR